MEIPLDKLTKSSFFHRSPSEGDVEDLVKSIAESGLIQPLCVYKNRTGQYEVFAGGRRLEALRQLGHKSAMCQVMDTQDENILKVRSLAENVCRKPLSMMEKCEAVHMLYKVFSPENDVATLMKKTGFSKSVLREYLSIRDGLSPDILDKLDKGEITVDTAVTLAKTIKDKAVQQQALEQGEDAKGVKDWAEKNTTPKPKRGSTTKPWIFDEDGNPLIIPEQLHKKILQLVRSST